MEHRHRTRASPGAGRVRVGTSGYEYDHWRKVLYPPDLPRRQWLHEYSRAFGIVEINNTFYRLPPVTSFERWRHEAPEGFRYALKFSRYGSHLKHLKDPGPTLRAFLDRAELLEDRLGPILVQLPPRWHRDALRLDAFLSATPGRHRWAVEFRHESWLSDAVMDVLRRRGAALCIHDLLPNHPWTFTADWFYVRYHGRDYASGYSHQRLAADAGRIAAAVRKGRDAYVFFNNDLGGDAVTNALQMRRYLVKRLGTAAS